MAFGALEEVKCVERGLALQEAPPGEDARRRDQPFLGLRARPNDGGVIKRIDCKGQTTRNRGLQPPRDVNLADAGVDGGAVDRLLGIGIGLLDGEAGELLPRPETRLSERRKRRVAIGVIAPRYVPIELGEVSPNLARDEDPVILVAGVNRGKGLGDRRHRRPWRIVEIAVVLVGAAGRGRGNTHLAAVRRENQPGIARRRPDFGARCRDARNREIDIADLVLLSERASCDQRRHAYDAQSHDEAKRTPSRLTAKYGFLVHP